MGNTSVTRERKKFLLFLAGLQKGQGGLWRPARSQVKGKLLINDTNTHPNDCAYQCSGLCTFMSDMERIQAYEYLTIDYLYLVSLPSAASQLDQVTRVLETRNLGLPFNTNRLIFDLQRGA